MTDGNRSGLAGAGLVALAAVCFGTLGPITRFADEAGVGSLAIVAWRAGIGATAMILLLLTLRGAAGRRPVALRELPSRDRWFIGAASVANLVLNLAMFIAFVRVEIGWRSSSSTSTPPSLPWRRSSGSEIGSTPFAGLRSASRCSASR